MEKAYYICQVSSDKYLFSPWPSSPIDCLLWRAIGISQVTNGWGFQSLLRSQLFGIRSIVPKLNHSHKWGVVLRLDHKSSLAY